MKTLAASLLAASAFAATAALAADGLDGVLGRALFERSWVTAGASTDAADGLGPLFNARSCSGCHAGEALSARFTATPDGHLAGRGLVVRFGDSAGAPDPIFGHQLQTAAIAGMPAEGRVVVAAAADGSDYGVSFDLEDGSLAEATRSSIRIAPPLAGRGGLERVADASILAHADPDDRDGDGVSGRVNWVATESGQAIGRFGWKAQNSDLLHQIAGAMALDLGLSSPLVRHPHGDCTEAQADCLAAPTGVSDAFEGEELSTEMVDLVRTYVAGIPAHGASAGVTGESAGSQLFAAAGCSSCHVPELADSAGKPVPAYTDLLLHDLGPALDDGMGEPGVASAEWRTAPLIAVGAPGRRFLNNGSAATVDAAVRAHGGEAQAAHDRYLALGDDERQVLVDFVESL